MFFCFVLLSVLAREANVSIKSLNTDVARVKENVGLLWRAACVITKLTN